MSLPKINLVVIGHKDHGKSTLIGRLLYDSQSIHPTKLQEIKHELAQAGSTTFELSFLVDSLEEEREGGLTIDIMHIPFKTETFEYHIIDCPGHREFIKNMITGASQADTAILVVSAKEGIEAQTKQHLFLATTLGITQMVIVINKMDRVNYREEAFKHVTAELETLLTSLNLDVAIVPVSAMQGDNVFSESQNMPWYRGRTLIRTLDQTVQPANLPQNKPLRGTVQDVYDIDGASLIICKIATGVLNTGDTITFHPSHAEGQVAKIESFGSDRHSAAPGDSVGVIINGIGPPERGEVISTPANPPLIVHTFTAQVILLSDLELKQDDEVMVRYGTAVKRCRILKMMEKVDPVNLTIQEVNPDQLHVGDVGTVCFQALEPMILERFSETPELGRFVIEGSRGAGAAGIVLDVAS
jgi:elongation factor 1-alpha